MNTISTPRFLLDPRLILALATACLLSCTNQPQKSGPAGVTAKPPVATVKPHVMEEHGGTRTDNYFWLKERDTPEVLDYLKAENAYTDEVMGPNNALHQKIFGEMKSRLAPDESTPPTREGSYYYYERYEEGGQYPIYCRKKTLDGEEEIILDANKMAEGQSYFSVRGLEVSPDENILAFSVDTVGRRIYNIFFKDLTTGELLPDKIEKAVPNYEWANDNKTLFYTRQDLVTLRYAKIYRHTLGTDPAEDTLIYEEKDDTFRCFVGKSSSGKYLIIMCGQTLSTEMRLLDADNPQGEFEIFQPRQRDHIYQAHHHEDYFYVLTNHEARNFKIMKTKVGQTGMEHWEEVIPHRDDTLLDGVDIFKNYMVLGERTNGQSKLRIFSHADNSEHYVDFDEDAYTVFPAGNEVYDTKTLRFLYGSLTTPETWYDYEMDTKKRTLIKQQKVMGDYDPNNYKSERIFAKARDGVEIPISLIYRKDLYKQGENPLLLYGYGSYGATIDPNFRSDRLSVIDRGFVYAIAHIRGSQMMGRQWYEDGKLLKKKNTFTDFVDCGNYLVSQKYGHPDKLFAMGGSAGGLLMGAVLNLEPTMFRGVVAAVPFVDVITTMLDDSIPLTTSEYDEWGNPNEKDYYDYMLSYSPYDQVAAVDYTNILVTTGYHDSQVQYWEPAKWVAKLRAMKTDNNLLMLKTNMEAGHGGASGRYNRLEERAFDYTFMLSLLDIKE